MSKRMMISGTFGKKDGDNKIKILEIHPQCIESLTHEPGGMFECRTVSGQTFLVSQEVHDAIIKEEGGLR